MNVKQARCGYVTTVLGAALLGLPGCGSGSGSGSTGSPVPATELPTQGAAAVCDGLGSCCRSQGFAFDDTGCRSAWQTQIAANAPTSPAVVYDASAAGQCLETIRTVFAQCARNLETLDTDACSRMYVGTRVAGAACTESQECAKPAAGVAFCETSTSADGGVSSGVCAVDMPMAHATLGQACSTTCTTESTSQSCYGPGSALGDAGTVVNVACYTNDGLYCSSGTTCQPVSEVGGPCDGYAGCVNTAYCDSTTRLCVARAQVGATCSSLSDSCVDTAYCSTAGVCEAKKADGETCATFGECLGYCSIASGATTGACTGASTLFATAENCAAFGMSSTD